MTTDAVTDVGDATFVAEVLERSHELPVVVDFWAPWCEPCRIIGPILEQLATEYAGRVALVKLDVDENPAVSTQYGIRSIPAVTAFRDGRPASQFVGAIPEPQARTFFESLLPTEAEVAAKAALAEAVEARAAGDVDGARDRYESVLAADGTHRAAALGLAELEYEAGDLERAEELAARWELEPEGKRLLGLIRMRQVAGDASRDELEAHVAADAGDAEARYALGSLLATEEQWAAALEHLLATVRLDRRLDDDGARRRMLDVFTMLGDDHALTEEYRRLLAGVLF